MHSLAQVCPLEFLSTKCSWSWNKGTSFSQGPTTKHGTVTKHGPSTKSFKHTNYA